MVSAVVDIGLRNPLEEDDVALLIRPFRCAKCAFLKAKVQKFYGAQPSPDPTPSGKGDTPPHTPLPSWPAATPPGPPSSKNRASPL